MRMGRRRDVGEFLKTEQVIEQAMGVRSEQEKNRNQPKLVPV